MSSDSVVYKFNDGNNNVTSEFDTRIENEDPALCRTIAVKMIIPVDFAHRFMFALAKKAGGLTEDELAVPLPDKQTLMQEAAASDENTSPTIQEMRQSENVPVSFAQYSQQTNQFMEEIKAESEEVHQGIKLMQECVRQLVNQNMNFVVDELNHGRTPDGVEVDKVCNIIRITVDLNKLNDDDLNQLIEIE